MSTNITIPVPAVPFAPPVYTCHRAKKPFELDGNINKPFWEDAPYTDEFLDIEGSHMPLPRFVTRAKMLWDDENLYVAAVLDGDEIWGHQTERDSVIFLDNDFEIFVDPDSDTYHYYEFEMNVLNTVWDLFLSEPYRDGGSGLNGYDMHGLRTAVHVDGSINDPSAENKGWSVEVVIPFGDAPCDITIPEDEYRKWELRKLYYAENILFETTGSYSDSLTVLQETLAAYAPNDFNKTVKALDYTIETTSHSYLITCPSADGAHLLLLYSNGKVEKVTR